MTISLYDPLAPDYFDPAAARAERDRTFQICSDCRLCVRLCPSFKDLFKFVDADEDATDVSVLSDDAHRHVVDECYQCKLCYVVCPYTPDQGAEWKVDFPRLMLRSLAIQTDEHKAPKGANLLARTDLQGKVATSLSGLVNSINKVKPARSLMESVTGISKDRLLPTFAKTRFSKWFRQRVGAPGSTKTRDSVALFTTCLIEYQEPDIGKDLVGVCERNGITCELPDGEVCCGMPWLDAGDTKRFEEQARRNVEVLTPAVEAGRKILVAQPTCAYVLKNEYPDFLGTAEAEAVGAATMDAAEYLMAQHREDPLDTDFEGSTYESITWQAACHYRAQQIGPKSRDLMALTGAKVQMVERCAAIDGTWGLRAENYEAARKIAKPLMEAIEKSDADLIAGDCQLANTAIVEETGKVPLHPVQVLARAYGISANNDAGRTSGEGRRDAATGKE